MNTTNEMQLYRLIFSQLYMFRVMFSPIIRSTWLYLQHLVVFTNVAVGWQRHWCILPNCTQLSHASRPCAFNSYSI